MIIFLSFILSLLLNNILFVIPYLSLVFGYISFSFVGYLLESKDFLFSMGLFGFLFKIILAGDKDAAN